MWIWWSNNSIVIVTRKQPLITKNERSLNIPTISYQPKQSDIVHDYVRESLCFLSSPVEVMNKSGLDADPEKKTGLTAGQDDIDPDQGMWLHYLTGSDICTLPNCVWSQAPFAAYVLLRRSR